MAWDATTEESTSNVGEGTSSREPGLALAVAWSRDEPWRVGEVLFIGPGDRRVHVFGRGDEPPEAPNHNRLRLIQQRPGQNSITPPLGSPKVSRSHLRIQRVDGRTLAIENLGKRALLVRGREVHQAVLRPLEPGRAGEPGLLEIQGELGLILVERNAVMAPLSHAAPAPLPGFGAPCSLGLIGESPVIWALRDQLAFAGRERGPTLVHGPLGSGLAEVALAAQRAGAGPRESLTLDVAALPREAHHSSLFGEAGCFARGRERDLVLLGIETLDPATGVTLGRALSERRVALDGTTQLQPLEQRVVATTSAPELLPDALRGAFHHLVRSPALSERREDLPFIALDLLRSILQSEALFKARHPEPPVFSAAFARALPQLPLDGGLGFLRALLVRSLALSTGRELVAPPDLDTLIGRAGPLPAVSSPASAAPVDAPAPPQVGPPQAATRLPADVPASVGPGLAQLTRAERVVLQHLACNMTSREIGKTLFVSVRTIQNHRARICEKLGLRGNNALLGVAVRLRDYLGPPPVER